MKYILIVFLFPLTVLILYPLFPKISYEFHKNTYEKSYQAFTTSFHTSLHQNMLIMPQIGVFAPIKEGDQNQALREGVWHETYTGTPDRGNMVLAGHRFLYLPPNNTTLYNLDEVKIGEKIYVFWNTKMYTFKISSIQTVTPDDLHILDQSSHQLTIYTCTPLWTAANRLVVISKLI